ncbi:alpha/beta-hydrolase [Durotheca rogersii]|uniref:alpha/beta-hydrolase n=1 Tax=Durotheca rogersii TaxID=419775 RepID=UPI00221F77D4|nr:alpha/beta-hydrolase [Durotheca rogersii]KAI5862787.1 alpha/beta-hydrolase [Durotheca rogersii]
MAAVVEEAVTAGGADEVKPYKIHVSSKYLDLTRQKLEVTRLPHELADPKSKDWWEPKSQIEPLIDYWLEQYSWRTQEELLNTELPQFRTGLSIPSAKAAVRIHFIHVHSSHANAIPLLLIPPFPFSNLSLAHLIKLFITPEDDKNDQSFHLVIPSLPGLGFSDALPNNTPVISATAELLNALMSRLSYPHYLATNTGAGTASPAEIDFKLADYLVTCYPDSCLGAHFLSPPLTRPRMQEAPIEWARWRVAKLFRSPMLGYHEEDFLALRRTGYVRRPKAKKSPTPAQFGLNNLSVWEPNTLAYALCDSPTGLLVFVLKGLRLLSPQKDFTPTEIINFAQLAWLPGPEAAMRFWAHCISHPEKVERKAARKPKIGVTVFLGEKPNTEAKGGGPEQEGAEDCYTCPSWANVGYNVVYTRRATGRSGLLAWEQPETIVAGIRGVAAAVLKSDTRLRPARTPAVALLEQVPAHTGVAGGQAPSVPRTSPASSRPAPERPEEHNQPHRKINDEAAVGSSEKATDKELSTSATPSPAHG